MLGRLAAWVQCMREGYGMQYSRRDAIRIGAITALGLGSTLTAKASTAYDIDYGVGATLDRSRSLSE